MISFPYVYGSGGSSGQTFTFDDAALFQYPETVIVPATVTRLAGNTIRSFYNHTEIKHITFEGPLTGVPSSAFSSCSGLESIELPDNLTTIGTNAFAGCASLTDITMPDTVTAIQNAAFSQCTALEEITLSAGLTTLGSNVFQNCTALKNVSIPAGVTTLQSTLFTGCTSLVSFTVPATVTTLQNGVFNGCTGLTTLIFGGIPACSYYTAANASNPLYRCTALEDVQLPAGWTENLLISNGTTNFTNVLTHDSMVAMIANLYDYTDGTAHTLTLGAANLARLSAEEKAAATAKNWTLA